MFLLHEREYLLHAPGRGIRIMLEYRCCWDNTSKLYKKELVQDKYATVFPI